METLETTETLADDSSRKPPEYETLEVPVPKTLAAEPVDEVKTLAMPEVANELGLGLSRGSSLVGDETPFAVGDFVWGKIKSHLWWPGQVYDPSGASDHAKKVRRKDHRSILVAYLADGTFAWCHPSQLKSFVENFHQMVSQSSSKSFMAALETALAEIGRCLEVQMTCYCVPEEEREAQKKYFSMNAGISNYLPSEFLGLIKDVALDSSVVDILEITLLRSWVVAFGKGCSYIDSTVNHRRRRGIMDLVDKIDLDALPMDSLEGKEEEECWITGSGVVKGPEISSPNEKSNRSKKKRSMAALIAEMDLDSVELSDSEEEKKNESGKGSWMENGGSIKEEETGSGRRERKKSKYLSPPYTYLSGYTKWLVSPKSSETKTPRDSQALLTGSSSAILKCNSEEFPKEEDEKSSPLFKVDGISTTGVLSELLATALNPLHLKWNRSAKMVRGFFAIFRSSVYSSGAEFDAYQKQLANSVGGNGKIVNKEVGDKSEEGNKSEEKRGRKRKDKAKAEKETPIDLGHHTSDLSEKKDKAKPKRKMVKEGANGKTPVNSELCTVPVSDEGKKGKSKSVVNLETTVDLGHKPVNNVELGKTGQKLIKGKEVANRRTLTELDREVCNRIKDANLGQKKRKSKDGPSIEVPINFVSKIANGLEEGKSGQKRKNKDATGYEDPAALVLTFSPGISLPSKEDLISAFGKYGPLIESETELLKESGSARVVFVRSSDAEKAFNNKAGAFGPPVASYRLRYLTGNLSSPPPLTPIPVPKPPLPYIRKSLERMISTLNGPSPLEKVAGSSEGLKPEARDNLVGEMQGLLTKVNKMLSGPTAGTST